MTKNQLISGVNLKCPQVKELSHQGKWLSHVVKIMYLK